MRTWTEQKNLAGHCYSPKDVTAAGITSHHGHHNAEGIAMLKSAVCIVSTNRSKGVNACPAETVYVASQLTSPKTNTKFIHLAPVGNPAQ